MPKPWSRATTFDELLTLFPDLVKEQIDYLAKAKGGDTVSRARVKKLQELTKRNGGPIAITCSLSTTKN